MGRDRSLHRVVFVLLAVSALVLQAVPAQAGIARGSFHQTNLVSDRADLKPKPNLVDPDLVNPWGLSSSPTSPIWVSDNGTHLSTLYNTAGQKQGLVVQIPGPGDGASGGPHRTPPGPGGNQPSPDLRSTAGAD